MIFWRRAIALVMLVVMLPASVLAAMPMRFCEGSDGHRALEFVVAGAHHVDDQAVQADGDADHDAAVTTGADCRDTPIFGSLRLANRTSDATQDHAFKSLAVLVAPAAVPTPQALRGASCPAPAKSTRVDPRLAAQRTVVLLN